MPVQLRQRLEVLAYLENALTSYRSRLTAADVAGLTEERDDVFMKIVTEVTSDPRVSLRQLRFFLDNVERFASDPEVLEHLRSAAREQIGQVEASLDRKAENSGAWPAASVEIADTLGPDAFRGFDMLADRVAVFDRDFRYVYTNEANGRFHARDPMSLVGTPSSMVVGHGYFERVSRSLFTRGLGGERLKIYATHPGRDQSKVYSVTIDPVRDGKGRVAAVIGLSRPVGDLHVPDHLVLR